MASKTASNCGPCSCRQMENNALTWCIDCKEGLCDDCQKFHSVSKASRSHDLIPYEKVHQLPEIAKNVRETCLEHNRKFEMYCSDHLEAYCIKCSTNNHKSCTSISLIEDVTINVKSSVALTHINERLDTLISQLEMAITKKEESVKAIGDQTEDIKKEVQGMQTNIQEKLSSLVEKVICDADGIRKGYEAKTSDITQTLNTNLKIVRELKVCVGQLIENGSNLQVFLCLKELDSLVASEENRLSTKLETGELHKTELCFKYDDDYKKLASVECVGSLTTEKKHLEISSGSFEQCALSANATQPEPRDINKLKLSRKITKTFPTKSKCVTNCIVLRNDCMLFTDFSDNNRLILLDANANFLRDIGMESKPFDVAIVTDDVIAISLTQAKKVVLLEFILNEDRIVKEMTTVGKFYGIDHCEHRLAVAVEGQGIQIFTDDGTQLRTIPFACTALAFIKSNIAYIAVSDNVIRCCNITGKHMWECKLTEHTFYSYPSITEDGSGCLYVTESGQNKVFIVSKDGSSCWKQLQQQSDGLHVVNGIYFNKRKQELLLVTKLYSSEAVLYSVTEDL